MLKVKIVVITLFIAIYLLSLLTGQMCGTSSGTPFWRHFVYMFFHANLLHLLLNCYSLWFVIHDRTYNIVQHLGLIYLISVLSSIIIVTEASTVGASAMVFGGVGIGMSANHSVKTWLLVIAILISGYFMKSVNADIHVVSFLLGLVVTKVYKQLKGASDDYRAVNKGE